jgi:hypothetical protein
MSNIRYTEKNVVKVIVQKQTAVEKARHTYRWTEIILRAVSARVAKRWRFVSLRGKAKGEWRGVVDVLAIRKDTNAPARLDLKRGDLFDIILIQMKGGSSKTPDAEERHRLREVAKYYRAQAVVLFHWDKGKATKFFTLNRSLTWELSACEKIFG